MRTGRLRLCFGRGFLDETAAMKGGRSGFGRPWARKSAGSELICALRDEKPPRARKSPTGLALCALRDRSEASPFIAGVYRPAAAVRSRNRFAMSAVSAPSDISHRQLPPAFDGSFIRARLPSPRMS